MKKKDNILVICRFDKDLVLLDTLRLKRNSRIIVASDDIEIQKRAKQNIHTNKIIFIERMESLYSVVNDVISILEKVNSWLKLLADEKKGITKDLLFWIRHAEGGMITQRIQDALLLIRLYQYIFKEYNVNRVIIRRHIQSRWEDEVLIQTARTMGIYVQEICPLLYRIGEKLDSIVRNRHLFGQIRRVCLPTQIVYILFQFKLILDIFWAKMVRKDCFRASDGRQEEIVFQLGDSALKHVENILPIMKEFQEKNRYKPVALCWQARGGAFRIRKEGLAVDQLEVRVPIREIWHAFWRLRYTMLKANVNISNFMESPLLKYRNVPLGKLLWPSIKYFLQLKLFRRFVLSQALKRYFFKHNIAAIKLWGGGDLDLGAITRNELTRDKKPLTFHYDIGVGRDWPYTQKNSDLYLVASQLDKERLERYGFPSHSIAIVGHPRYKDIGKFTKKYVASNSRRCLNMPLDKCLYVFYVPENIIRGVISAQEQYILADALFQFSHNYSDVALLIKPHPADDSTILTRLMKKYASSNIFMFEQSMLPYHCINSADIVITKFSTVGTEAMLLNRPVISVMLDNEPRWQTYFGEGVDYFFSVETLLTFLESTLENKQKRDAWIQRRLQAQNQFIKQRFTGDLETSATRMADAIIERIQVNLVS